MKRLIVCSTMRTSIDFRDTCWSSPREMKTRCAKRSKECSIASCDTSEFSPTRPFSGAGSRYWLEVHTRMNLARNGDTSRFLIGSRSTPASTIPYQQMVLTSLAWASYWNRVSDSCRWMSGNCSNGNTSREDRCGRSPSNWRPPRKRSNRNWDVFDAN